MLLPVPDGGLVHNIHEGPDAPDEIVAGRRAADAARRIVAGLTATRADAATLAEVAAGLEAIAEVLDPHTPTTRFPETGLHGGVQADSQVWESHPFIGPGHPLAPPLRIVREGDRAVGTATFGHVYEGPPGCLHGGIVAAMFDMVLGAAASFAQRPTLTGTLTVKYRRPTPLMTPIRYVGWIDRLEERKTITKGEAWSGDDLLAEGEAIFVMIDTKRYDQPRS
ncbi:MAG: PaaI family thioesterase [Acidimicrobiia bacterium]